MKRQFKNLICIVLSLFMITQVSPISAIAAEVVEGQQNTSYDSTEDIVIESEVESMRTENSKTYVTDDGAYYQVSAAVPIHEENANGELEEIAEINRKVETAQDAQDAVLELATYANEIGNESGFFESETLQMYSNGTYNPMKIAGVSVTGSDLESCIYVKPNIITNKSVFINHAELRLTTGSVVTTGNSNRINVFRLQDDISTLENVPLGTYDTVIIDNKYATSNNNNCTIDITSYAHYSSLGVYENTGLALEPAKKETSIEVKDIVLSIYYREIGDIDKNIESESVDLGRAGTLYVNDYTCTPTIVKNDLGIFDELEEVNIQTIVNPVALDDNISDGANTRTNYYSVIQFATSEYYWKSCEGDYIYFVKNTDREYVGTDSSGEKYILTCANNRENFEQVSITSEKDNTKYSFTTINGKGYLSKIKDKYNNEINVSYSGNNISYITDGSGRRYQYNYIDGMLSSISVYYTLNGIESPVKINDEAISINYEYDSASRLSKVIYPDNYCIKYSYDNNGRITSVNSYTDLNDTDVLKGLSLAYANNNSNILESYSLTHKGKTVKSVDVNYPNDNVRNRVFTNYTDGTKKIMQYDMNSNLIHFKDYNGQEYYIDYENNELKKLIYSETTTDSFIKNGDFESETTNWTIAESSSIVNNAPKKEGTVSSNKALKIMADNALNTDNVQTVTVVPGKSYVLSCSAYCDKSMPFNSDRYFSVRVTGSLSGTFIGETNFDYGITEGWQTSKCVIKIPASVSAVKISINSLGMPGACYFDDLSIYPVNDENTVDVSNTGDIPNDKIIRNPNGTIHDIIKKENTSNNTTLGIHYDRDSHNYVSALTEDGKSTYYNYDCTNGLLMSKGKNTDSSKNTQYTYSGIGALTAVNQAITTINGEVVNQDVTYAYDDDKISSIYHNGCLYEYSYYDDGKISGIQVKEPDKEDGTKGNVNYSISYEYNLDNVGKVIFGNGASIVYVYSGNKVTETIYDNGKTGDENQVFAYKYKYNDDGSVKSMTDEVSNTVTTYTDKGCTVTKGGDEIYSDTGNRIKLFGTSLKYSQDSSQKNNITTITDTYTKDITIYPSIVANTSLDGLERGVSNSIECKGSADYKTHYKLTGSTNYIQGTYGRETELVKSYVTNVAKKSRSLDTKYSNTRLTREWNYRYDDVGRVTSVFKKSYCDIELSTPNKSSYTYNEGDLAHYYKYDEGGQVSFELNLENDMAIEYAYNAGGNIASKTMYEKIGTNSQDNQNFSYDYLTDKLTFTPSSSGNTTNFTYKSNGMTDYLTSFNGQKIEYDKSGNPTHYAGTGMGYVDVSGDMTWNGNLLTSFKSGSDYYKYAYDGDGRRTSKIHYKGNNKITETTYIWTGDTLSGYRAKWYGEVEGYNEYQLVYDKTIKLVYSDGDIVGVCVVANPVDLYEDIMLEETQENPNEEPITFDWDKSVNYTFVKDGQGNITEIYDPTEKIIVSMSYDSYGNMTPNFSGSFIKEVIDKKIESNPTGNPWSDIFIKLLIALAKVIIISTYIDGIFLSVEQGYKGYIYDKETGLYYNQQRYYSPSWGRFINASDPMTLTENMDNVYSANLFNYCGNDPVNNLTKTGFNSPCIVIKDAILPQLTTSELNLFNEDRATAKYNGEISTAFDALALGLRTTNNYDTLKYWDNALDKKSNIVDSGYGLNYIQSAITKNRSSVTKYSIEETNTPYKSAQSIN